MADEKLPIEEEVFEDLKDREKKKGGHKREQVVRDAQEKVKKNIERDKPKTGDKVFRW